MKPGPRIAIDFGTTRTKVAYYDPIRNEPKLIELGRETRSIIPSIFYLPRQGEGKILVGDDAMDQLNHDASGIVREIKRDIDKPGKCRVGAGRMTATRVELATEMLRMIRRRCEEGIFHDTQIHRCTLTVPVCFTEGQRKKLEQAATKAGFTDVRLMAEPTAAANAWFKRQGERLGDHVVVVDIGGGTTDLALVQWSGDRFVAHENVLPDGFPKGGNDVDDQACEELLNRILKKRSGDDKKRTPDGFLVKLRRAKERMAAGLKKMSFYSGRTEVKVRREDFQQAEKSYLVLLEKELRSYDGKCQSAGVDSPIAILVGGASRMEGLKQKVEAVCKGKVYTWEEADFATVLGAVEYPAKKDNTSSYQSPSTADACYREALKAVIADNVITLEEVTHLKQLREEFQLSPEVVEQLELTILGQRLTVSKKKPTITRTQIHDLIGDGRCLEALQLTSEALTQAPDIDLFELWQDSLDPIADADTIIQSGRLILAVRGDLWGHCCVAIALNACGRFSEATKYCHELKDKSGASAPGLNIALFVTKIEVLQEDFIKQSGNRERIDCYVRERPHSTALAFAKLVSTTPDDFSKLRIALKESLVQIPHSCTTRLLLMYFAILSDELVENDLKEYCSVLNRVSYHHPASKTARALLAASRGDYEKAIGEFEGVPEHPFYRESDDLASRFYCDRGWWHQQLAQTDEAKRAFRMSIERSTDSPAYFAYGRLLYEEENYGEARKMFEACTIQFPTEAEVWVYAGWTSMYLGEDDRAKNEFASSLKADSSNQAAQFGIVATIVRTYYFESDKVFFYGGIPEDKAANAYHSYIRKGGLKDASQIVLLHDSTVWGSANEGFSIYPSCLCWKELLDDACHIPLRDIRSTTISSNFFGQKVLVINQTKKLTLGEVAPVHASVIKHILDELSAVARYSPPDIKKKPPPLP